MQLVTPVASCIRFIKSSIGNYTAEKGWSQGIIKYINIDIKYIKDDIDIINISVYYLNIEVFESNLERGDDLGL